MYVFYFVICKGLCLDMFGSGPMFSSEAKKEHEASAKRRRTEWQSGLANLPGDVTLVKDQGFYNPNIAVYFKQII